MRTNWGARANQDTPELLPDYEPSVGAVAKALKSYWGKEVSDPVKVAQVVPRLAASDSLPAHLLIGSDAVRFAGEAEKTREAEAAQWRQMSLSTDVDSSTVLPDMRFLRYGLCAHGRGERTPGWNDSLTRLLKEE
jgi:hypothetical protein